MGGNEFPVTVNHKEVVAPVFPLQEHWLTFSNLDLLLPPLEVGVFFCYKKPTTYDNFIFPSMVGALKKAMAQALVPYYAFAGEVIVNSVGEPELLCNNRGVDFIEAYADVKLRDIEFYNPETSVEGKLVPKMKEGVLSVQASSNGYKRSKLESFSAFLWKIIGKSASCSDAKSCKMGIIVDGRSRLAEGEDDEKASTMARYFGNVLSIPFGEASVHELITKPLRWVANVVHEFLQGAVTKEHFLGLIDWVEINRPEPSLAKIYCRGGDGDGPAFVVSSGQRFPVTEVDFGWGKPVLGSYHFPWGGDAGYVMPMPMPMPSPSRSGDWLVYVHLSIGQIALLEKEAGDVFRPLKSDYLT